MLRSLKRMTQRVNDDGVKLVDYLNWSSSRFSEKIFWLSSTQYIIQKRWFVSYMWQNICSSSGRWQGWRCQMTLLGYRRLCNGVWRRSYWCGCVGAFLNRTMPLLLKTTTTTRFIEWRMTFLDRCSYSFHRCWRWNCWCCCCYLCLPLLAVSLVSFLVDFLHVAEDDDIFRKRC